MEVYLGIDIGSVTTKVAALSSDGELIASNYLRTQGKPIAVAQRGPGRGHHGERPLFRRNYLGR